MRFGISIFETSLTLNRAFRRALRAHMRRSKKIASNESVGLVEGFPAPPGRLRSSARRLRKDCSSVNFLASCPVSKFHHLVSKSDHPFKITIKLMEEYGAIRASGRGWRSRGAVVALIWSCQRPCLLPFHSARPL